MAYGIKYRHTYCNEYGTSSTITILENGYSGAIKEIDAQEDPIVISQEGSDTDKFDTIRPSTASIGLIGSDTFKLEELFTADERKYMVENHVGGVMVWRGFVIPNGFSHEWTGGEFPMEIIASDNLSTLKDFPFLNDNGTVISGRLNHVDILLKCLNKLDIGIDLLTLTAIARQGGISGEDPLFINTTDAYTFLNTNVREEGIDFYYENPENAFNCEDVVNAICRLYGAKLYQSKGQWRFKRVNVDYGASISGQEFHRYNTSGVKIGTVPYDEVITIPCNDYSGVKAQYSGARLAMSEVYKSAHSRYGYRYLTVGDKLPAIIKNQELGHSFPTATPAVFVPTNWTVTLPFFAIPPAVRTISIAPELRPIGDFPPNATGGALRIYGGNRRGGDSLRSSPVDSVKTISKGDRLSLKFWHKIPLINPLAPPRSFYLFVRIYLQTRNPAKIYVLSNNDTVLSLDNPIIPRVNSPSWQSMDITSSAIMPTAMSFVGNRPNEAWVQEYILSQPAPEDGVIVIEFAGIGIPEGETQPALESRTGTVIPVYAPSSITQGVDDFSVSYSQQKARIYSNEFKIGELETGILFGGDTHPSGIKYTSEQSAKYTQRGNEVPLLTSDVEDKNAISGILTLGNFVDKWNDSRNPYNTFKPLGLLLTRDIMRQYKNVWRVIEEDIKANGLSFDTTIEFEERPGERYVVQRGSISQKFNRLIGCTLIQVSANPDTAFVGSETIEEDFSSSGGSSGGSGGGGSGGGGGSAPQDLQSVTDIGAETTNIITVKGVRAETLLEIPDVAPVLADRVAGKTYIYANPNGSGTAPSPVLGNLEDLQNVADIIANGKFLQKINGVWTGVDVSLPDLSSYATQSWVTVQLGSYVPTTRTINGKALTGDIILNAADVGAMSETTADGKYVTIATKQTVTGAKYFSGAIGLPNAEPTVAQREAGVTYIYANGDGSGSTPPPVLGNLEDLQNVQSTIANGKYLQKIAGIWTGVDITFPSLAGYALESWVTAGFAAKNDTRILNGQTAYGWGDHANKYLPFGINTTNISKNITVDLDTITDSIFYTNTSSTNKPFNINSTVLSMSGSTGYGGQIAFPINNARGAVYRKNEGGVWTAWRELWDSSNLRSNTANDSRYVLKSGDTMTGTLGINNTGAFFNLNRIDANGGQLEVGKGGGGTPFYFRFTHVGGGSNVDFSGGSSYGFDTKLTAPSLEARFNNGTNFIKLATPFDGGLSILQQTGVIGLYASTNSATNDTIFQSKRNDIVKNAYNLLFQNRGGGFGIGVDTIPANMKFQIGYTAGAVLVGSVTLTKNSSNITGLYTRFLNYFKKGQRIQIKGVWYYVASVNSATSITISTNSTTLAPHIYLGETENNLDYFRDPINTFSVATNGDVIIGDKLTVPLAKVTRTLGIPTGVPPIGDREAGITYLYALT